MGGGGESAARLGRRGQFGLLSLEQRSIRREGIILYYYYTYILLLYYDITILLKWCFRAHPNPQPPCAQEGERGPRVELLLKSTSHREVIVVQYSSTL